MASKAITRQKQVGAIEKIKMPQRFWEDDKWAIEHYMQLQDKYVDKWVAIVNKEVVAVAEGPIDARTKAQEKTGIKEIPVIFVESGQNIYQN